MIKTIIICDFILVVAKIWPPMVSRLPTELRLHNACSQQLVTGHIAGTPLYPEASSESLSLSQYLELLSYSAPHATGVIYVNQL